MRRAALGFALLLASAGFERRVHASATWSSSETAMTLNEILLADGWRWTRADVPRALVDGQMRALVDVVNVPSRIHADNVHRTSGLVYATFACQCVRTIDRLLRLTRSPLVRDGRRQPSLSDVNRTVLKTIASLFRLADVAPGVLSYDPDVLVALLSANARVNRLIDRAPGPDEYDWTVFQTINAIERFAISNCPLRAAGDGTAGDGTADPARRLRRSIDEFDAFLDDAGLLTGDFAAYNVGDVWPARLADDGPTYDVIARVLRGLAAVTDVRNVCAETGSVDVDWVSECQRSAFRLIMTIVYRKTETELRDRRDRKRRGRTNGGESFRAETFDVATYERLAVESRLLQFPRDFVGHVELLLKMTRDDWTVGELDIVTRKINEHLSVLDVANGTYLNSAGERVVTTGLELHAFIEEILSIPFVEHFNRIYRLFWDDSGENHGTRHEHGANETFRYADRENDRDCVAVRPLYARCFDVEMYIDDLLSNGHDDVSEGKNAGDLPKKNVDELKAKTVQVHAFLVALAAEGNGSSAIDVVTYAQRYLGYNITYFPDAAEKIRRIFYHVTNMIDKYQSIACKWPRYRDSRYDEYVAENKTLMTNLNQRNHWFAGKKMTNIKSAYDKSAFDDLSYGKFFKDLQKGSSGSVRLFWRGVPQTIEEISADVMRNVFDISYIPKYVRLVSRWTGSIVSRALIDYANYLVLMADSGKKEILATGKTTTTATTIELFFNKFVTIYNFPEHFSATFKTVATNFVNVSVRSDPLLIFTLKIMLEELLERYEDRTDFTTVPASKFSYHVNKLSVMFDKLKTVWKLKVVDGNIVEPSNKTTGEEHDETNNGVNEDVTGEKNHSFFKKLFN